MGRVIGRRVRVVVDRPLGSAHPNHSDLIYPVNYGFIPGLIAPDGEEQDAYILGPKAPLEQFDGIVRAVLIRDDDIETKWVVEPEDAYPLSDGEILAMVSFQEQFFRTRISREDADE